MQSVVCCVFERVYSRHKKVPAVVQVDSLLTRSYSYRKSQETANQASLIHIAERVQDALVYIRLLLEKPDEYCQ